MHTHTIVPRTRFRLALLAALGLALAGLLVTALPARAQERPDLLPGQQGLRINEFMASNQTAVPDPADPKQFPDWVEIYNPSVDPVSLNGLALTDREIDPGRAPIPDGLIVPANGYLVFYLDGDLDQGKDHLDLGLSASGEFIGLFEVASGTKIDGYDFGPQTPDVSEGRIPDGSGTFQPIPRGTPGRSNQLNAPVIANVTRSIVQPQAGDTVEISAEITDEGGTVVAATLWYSTPTISLVSVNLVKNGNTYKATIPANINTQGTFVRYFLRAQDNDGYMTESRWDGYVVGYVAPVLKINEFMAENRGLVRDPDDPYEEYPDWMELYNPGDAPVSLDGLYLTDNPRRPDRYAIPPGHTVPPKGVLLIWLDDDEEQGPAIHTNFSLDKAGEFLGLYGARGTVEIDATAFGRQNDNVAMGRYPDGEGDFIVLVCSTPGKKNMLCDEKNYLPVLSGPLQ
jgi:hypothetical protein